MCRGLKSGQSHYQALHNGGVKHLNLSLASLDLGGKLELVLLVYILHLKRCFLMKSDTGEELAGDSELLVRGTEVVVVQEGLAEGVIVHLFDAELNRGLVAEEGAVIATDPSGDFYYKEVFTALKGVGEFRHAFLL